MTLLDIKMKQIACHEKKCHENDTDSKNEKTMNEELNSSSIKNAHSSGDGSLGRDEETLITKTSEEKKDAVKKDAEQY